MCSLATIGSQIMVNHTTIVQKYKRISSWFVNVALTDSGCAAVPVDPVLPARLVAYHSGDLDGLDCKGCRVLHRRATCSPS